MRLMHRNDLERSGIDFSQVESPFFAVSNVRRALHGLSSTYIFSLDVRTSGTPWTEQQILTGVERGQLLLVCDRPLSPLSDDTSGNLRKRPTSESPAIRPAPGVKPQEPGFYIVPKSTTPDALKRTLFQSPDAAVLDKFHSLNPDLTEVKAGSMIALSDPNNVQCTREERWLMEAAAHTKNAIAPLSANDADFMMRHREQIQSFLALSSTSIGAGEAVLAGNLNNLKNILKEIEALHQRAFLKDGHLRSPEFFAERKRLLGQLDTHLTSLTRRSMGIPDHPSLKIALGISSRSLVHRWTQAGAPGQIPGYATHIQKLAKASTVIKHGGWVGTSIGGAASYMKVQNVCSAGDSDACVKVKFTEAGSFAGSLGGGGAAGAALSAAVVGGLCVGLGIPTMGAATLACGLIVVGAGSVAGGAVGGAIGGWAGEKIYEAVK